MAEDHKHGEMDITEKEKTFEGFIRIVTWGAGVAIAILLFLAIFNS
ncbi:MAG: aa3-type cytochrome c oxidase subunit IV [Paracoccaceae bacterium]